MATRKSNARDFYQKNVKPPKILISVTGTNSLFLFAPLQKGEYPIGTQVYFCVFNLDLAIKNLQYSLKMTSGTSGKCPNDCSGNGTCSLSECYCKARFISDVCIYSENNLDDSLEPIEKEILSDKIEFFSIDRSYCKTFKAIKIKLKLATICL